MSDIIYIQTGEDVIKEIKESIKIDFSEIISEYLSIKNRFENLPELKTTPDQETLDYYNANLRIQRDMSLNDIKEEAGVLLTTLTAIRDAGLLPDKYESGFQTLKTFIERV